MIILFTSQRAYFAPVGHVKDISATDTTLLAFWVSLPVIIVERNSGSLSNLFLNSLARVDTFLLLPVEQAEHEFGGNPTRSNCPSE